jgi:hypothetical protein
VGASGEIIMDYSIKDALEAGFDRIVFIIRKDLDKDFREIIGNRIEKIADVSYAYQELDDLPEGFTKPADRTKPWGTGQAVLACKGIINEPFAVINADDYYGKEAFVKLHDYMMQMPDKKTDKFNFCMAGFILGNTLSDNGAVTRGVCVADEDDNLTVINETSGIEKLDGKAGVRQEDGSIRWIDIDSKVSMNMWGMTPDFLDYLDEGFVKFLSQVPEGDIKKEYLLPIIIGNMLANGEVNVKVLVFALVTLLCFSPIPGIIALYFALTAPNQPTEELKARNNKYSVIASIVGVVISIVFVGLLVVGTILEYINSGMI